MITIIRSVMNIEITVWESIDGHALMSYSRLIQSTRPYTDVL